jgi:hypothetical protein
MQKTNLLLFTIALMLTTSCTSIYMTMVTQKPVVESRESIAAFLQKNHFDISNAYYLDASIDSVNYILENKQIYLLFDSLGRLMYYPNNDCPYNYLNAITNKDKANTLYIDTDINLSNKVKFAKNLDGSYINLNFDYPYKYYLLIFWQKFLGGKRGYKNNVEAVAKELELRKDILVMKVNTDIKIVPAQDSQRKYKLSLQQNNDTVFYKIQ